MFSGHIQYTGTISNTALFDTMMLPPTVLVALATILMTKVVSAHPEELFDKRAHIEELTRHHVVAEVNSRALQACADEPSVKARREQAIARRAATFERLRQERGLADGKTPNSFAVEIQTADRDITAPFMHRRTAADFRKWSYVDHNQTGLVSYNPSTPAKDIFGANASCILAPDNANGPYFVSQELSKQSRNRLKLHRERTCVVCSGQCLSHCPIAKPQLAEKTLDLNLARSSFLVYRSYF